MQMFNSFIVLFEHALRPGGVYFIEDLLVSRDYVDGDGTHVMIEVIKVKHFGGGTFKIHCLCINDSIYTCLRPSRTG